MYIIIFTILLAVGAYVAWRTVQDKRVNKQNWDIQNKLVSLTEEMKISSESSSVEFDTWAELNDLIIETVTEYYNGSGDPQIERYENSMNFISQVEEKLKAIESGNDHKEELLNYIRELKLTRLSN